MFDGDSIEREFSEYALIARVKNAIEDAMVTGPEVGGALTAFRAAIDLARQISDVGKQLENSELIKLIAELNLEIANANLEVANVTNQLAEQRQENILLTDQVRSLELDLKSSTNEADKLFRKGDDLYYTFNDEGPFCPNCYISRKERSLLSSTPIGLLCPQKSCKWTRSKY